MGSISPHYNPKAPYEREAEKQSEKEIIEAKIRKETDLNILCC